MDKTPLEIAANLHSIITSSDYKLDDNFDEKMSKFDNITDTLSAEIKEMMTIIDQKKKDLAQIKIYRTESCNIVAQRVSNLTKSIQRYTSAFTNSSPYLVALSNPVPRPPPGLILHKEVESKNIRPLYINENVVLDSIVVSFPEDAPDGTLYYTTSTNQFGINIRVGSSLITNLGHIGEIFDHGVRPSTVILCNSSEHNMPCNIKNCTFRHKPPKKGEIRNYFNIPKLYTKWSGANTSHIGGLYIGSRSQLATDMLRYNKSEYTDDRNLYKDLAFHFLLTNLVIEKGRVVNPLVDYPPQY